MYLDPARRAPLEACSEGTANVLQAWGSRTAASLAAGNLELLAEVELPIVADAVMRGTLEPRRS